MATAGDCGGAAVAWSTEATGCCGEGAALGSAGAAGGCEEATVVGSAETTCDCAEVAVPGSTAATGDCGGAAAAGSADTAGDCAVVSAAGSAAGECNTADTGLERDGLGVSERVKNQKTKAPCNSARTINNHTTDTSTPGGTGIQPTRFGAPAFRNSRATAALTANEGGGAAGSR
jgi:hypothetical protein